MVGKKRLKIGKSKKGIDCQTKEIPMKWAFFAFLLLKSDDTSEGLGCTSEIKINRVLLCISLDLHYLCAVNSAKLLTLAKKKKEFLCFVLAKS